MKLQFTTKKSILLATAFVGIWLVGNGFYLPSIRDTYSMIVYSGPIWVPWVFLAYAIGRRSLTWKIVLAFAVAELMAIAAIYLGALQFFS